MNVCLGRRCATHAKLSRDHEKNPIPKAIMSILKWNKTIPLLLWPFFNLDAVGFRIGRFWQFNACVVQLSERWYSETAGLWRRSIVYQSGGPESVQINPSQPTRAWQEGTNQTSIRGGDSAAASFLKLWLLCLLSSPPSCSALQLSAGKHRPSHARVQRFGFCFGCFSRVLTAQHRMRPLPDSLEAIDQLDPFVSPGISDNVHFYHITLTEIEFPLMRFCVS